MDISVDRFDKDLHGDFLWAVYQDPEYCEFFRRMPPNWIRSQVMDLEYLAQCQLYVVHANDIPIGVAIVAHACPYSLTCQIGLLIAPEHRGILVKGIKVAFWALYKLCEMIFERTATRKVSVRFLSERKDIEKSLLRSAFTKEAEFKESCLCYGEFKDELEYAATRETYKAVKEFLKGV